MPHRGDQLKIQLPGRPWLVPALALAGGLTLLAVSIVAVEAVDLRRAAGTAGDPAAPVPAAAGPMIEPLTGPWVVAIQPGHWEVSDLPYELRKLRTSSGAQYGSVREVDVNLAVARALAAQVAAAGWKPILVPATVDPQLRADAFIALHADWGATPDRRGWKLSPPWRASGASKSLADALSAAFSAQPDLVHDTDGVTVNMRGYYAFNPRRFEHAASEYTPDVLIEMGFITNATDRSLLTDHPGLFANIVMAGLEKYFAGRSRTQTADLAPMQLPWSAAGPTGASVRRTPSGDSTIIASLDPGMTIMPVDEKDGWYEVFVRHLWGTGWVRVDELVPAQDPRWPYPGSDEPTTAGAGTATGS